MNLWVIPSQWIASLFSFCFSNFYIGNVLCREFILREKFKNEEQCYKKHAFNYNLFNFTPLNLIYINNYNQIWNWEHLFWFSLRLAARQEHSNALPIRQKRFNRVWVSTNTLPLSYVFSLKIDSWRSCSP